MSVKVSSDIASNMRKFITAEQKSVRKGLQKAGIFIKGEAVMLAPVEFGNLRVSAYYNTDISRGLARLRVGFTSKYAPYVHEAPMKLKGQPRKGEGHSGTYWQGGENKFLQKAVNRNKFEILKIIAKEAKF